MLKSYKKAAAGLLVALFTALLVSVTPAQAVDMSPGTPFRRLAEQGIDATVVSDAQGILYAAWWNAPEKKIYQAVYSNGQIIFSGALQFEADYGPVEIPGNQVFQRRLALAVTAQRLNLTYLTLDGSLCFTSRLLSGGGWDAPDCRLKSDSAPPRGLNMTALPDGRVAVIWEKSTGLGVAVRGLDGNFTSVTDPGDLTGERTNPRIAAYPDGRLAAVWQQRRADGLGNSYRSEVRGRIWSNNAWGEAFSISGFDENVTQFAAGRPSLAVDSTGKLHVAFTQFYPENPQKIGASTIVYRTLQNGNFSVPVSFVTGGDEPELKVSGSKVYLAWSADEGQNFTLFPVRNREIVFTYFDNGWQTVRNITFTSGGSYNPQMAVEPSGAVTLVWRDIPLLRSGGIMLVRDTRGGSTFPTGPAATDNTALQNYVARADSPVINKQTDRSFLWGPRNWKGSLEQYMEGPGGFRRVYYFDKARIEITDPNMASNQPGYFTNGLLVTEMASGRLQLGDQLFAGYDAPTFPVAGDPVNNSEAPTYASFRRLVYIPEIGQNERSTDRTGQAIVQCLEISGTVRSCNAPESIQYGTFIQETGHNIAAPFWQFMASSGPVLENGQLVQGRVFDWVSAMGFPIAEPFWVTTKLNGQSKQVLVQLFQRRVLTYTPGNPAGFLVEMGNVGQHYYLWRYNNQDVPWLQS